MDLIIKGGDKEIRITGAALSVTFKEGQHMADSKLLDT